MNTYTKLKDGTWGIRVTHGSVSVGSKVEVKTKDGKTRTETIAKVLWTGMDKQTKGQVAVCSIAPKKRDEREPEEERPAVKSAITDGCRVRWVADNRDVGRAFIENNCGEWLVVWEDGTLDIVPGDDLEAI